MLLRLALSSTVRFVGHRHGECFRCGHIPAIDIILQRVTTFPGDGRAMFLAIDNILKIIESSIVAGGSPVPLTSPGVTPEVVSGNVAATLGATPEALHRGRGTGMPWSPTRTTKRLVNTVTNMCALLGPSRHHDTGERRQSTAQATCPGNSENI